MAYRITYTASISMVPDGVQAQEVPNGSVLTFTGTAAVPGANAPTAANLTTGATAVATALNLQLQANITQIQGFASGGN